MAFPATQRSLALALSDARSIAVRVKDVTQTIRDIAASGPVVRERLINHMRALSQAVAQWDQIAAVPGIAQYARDQFDDQTLDIAAEFAAMRAEAVSLRDWIFANFPKQGSAWLTVSYDVNGTEAKLTIPQASLTEYVARCDALLATIA